MQSIVRGMYVTISNSTCGSFPGGNVTFTVTGGGTFVVTATVLVELDHTNGDKAIAELNIGNTTTDCSSTLSGEAVIQYTDPTGIFYVSVSMEHSFVVPSAGTYTFYVNGITVWLGGPQTTEFRSSSMVGVYYPA